MGLRILEFGFQIFCGFITIGLFLFSKSPIRNMTRIRPSLPFLIKQGMITHEKA